MRFSRWLLVWACLTAMPASQAQSLTTKAGDPAAGRAIVADRQKSLCLLCHSGPFPEWPLQGNLGPDLRQSAQTLSESELRNRIVNPAQFNPQTVMPAYYRVDGLTRVASQYQGRSILSAEEIENVVAFLVSLKQPRSELSQ